MGMGKQRILANDLVAALWRFPLPILCSLALTYIAWEYSATVPAKLSFGAFLSSAFFWTLATSLWGEARGLRLIALMAGMAGIAILGYIFDAPAAFKASFVYLEFDWEPINVSHGFLSAAIVLAVTVAPYATLKASSEAVWQFNHRLVLAFLMAFLGALLAVGGYAAILATIDILFGVKFNTDNYWIGVVIGLGFIWPWIWLALLPSDFSDKPKTGKAMEFTSYAVALLVTYILIPLVVALSLILAVYVAQTLVLGSFNTARLGLMSLFYSGGIILVALLAYPQREESRYVGVFWRVFPFLLIIPCVLLFSALWVRIIEYGWTPERYFALLAGVWAACIAVLGFVPRLRDDLRIITGLLAVMLAVTSFGPWSVADVSANGQYTRLERKLTEKGWLANGRWLETTPKAPLPGNSPDREKIRGALQILRDIGELDRLRPWFAGGADDPFRNSKVKIYDNLISKLNVGYLPYTYDPWENSVNKRYSVITPYIFTNPEHSYLIGPINGSHSINNTQRYKTPEGDLIVKVQDNILTIQNNQGKSATFDYSTILKNLPDTPEQELEKHMPLLVGGSGDLSVKLAFTDMHGSIKGENVKLGYGIHFYIVLPKKP